MYYNRKARRNIMKQLKMSNIQDASSSINSDKKINSFDKWLERLRRSKEAGNQIFLNHVQTIEDNQKKYKEEKEASILENKTNWYLNYYKDSNGNKLSKEIAEKMAKEKVSLILEEINKKEKIRSDEKALRKYLRREENLPKKEIKRAIREVRAETKKALKNK